MQRTAVSAFTDMHNLPALETGCKCYHLWSVYVTKHLSKHTDNRAMLGCADN